MSRLAAVLLFVVGCGTPQTASTLVDVPSAGFPSEPPRSSSPSDFRLPSFQETRLPNGLSVRVVPMDTLGVTYAWLVFDHGGETDPEHLPGLSRIVGRMLEEGTATRTSAELAEAAESLGAGVYAYADEESLYVTTRFATVHLPEMLGFIAELALEPAFDEAELDRFRRRQEDRLEQRENDAKFLAWRTFNAALYGAHPYAVVDMPRRTLERVRAVDLRRWHERHVVPNHASLIVAGDADPEIVASLASARFGPWEPRETARPVYVLPPSRGERTLIVVDRPNSVQSVIRLGNLTVSRHADDFVPLVVANHVLGGSPASRLFTELRERRGLTYGAWSWVEERVDVGAFVAQTSVRVDATREALDVMLAELHRITTEPPSTREVLLSGEALADAFPVGLDTPGKVARLVAQLRQFDLSDGYWNEYPASLREVTASRAHDAIREHVHPDELLVVIVGPAETVVPQLEGLGSVQVMRVTPEGLRPPLSVTEHGSRDGRRPPDLSCPFEGTEGWVGWTEASMDPTPRYVRSSGMFATAEDCIAAGTSIARSHLDAAGSRRGVVLWCGRRCRSESPGICLDIRCEEVVSQVVLAAPDAD